MAQEQMAQYYQQQQPPPQAGHAQMHQQPGYGGYQVGQQQPQMLVENHQYHQGSDAPPLPPEEVPDPPPPGWSDAANVESQPAIDNIETVAMDDGTVGTSVTKFEENSKPLFDHKEERKPVITQDYNHQPVAPVLPGMQTFDHNHGFDRPPPQQYSHAAVQPIDYGHGQSLDYGHQTPLLPGAQVYDYQPQFDSHYYHQQSFEMERHHPRFAHEHAKPKSHPSVDSLPDISAGLSGK